MKHNRRKFDPQRNQVINEQVHRLEVNDMICEVRYLNWLVNVAMVKKKNGKNRACIDFTDLNKACTKDNFLHQMIDLMVDTMPSMS